MKLSTTESRISYGARIRGGFEVICRCSMRSVKEKHVECLSPIRTQDWHSKSEQQYARTLKAHLKKHLLHTMLISGVHAEAILKIFISALIKYLTNFTMCVERPRY